MSKKMKRMLSLFLSCLLCLSSISVLAAEQSDLDEPILVSTFTVSEYAMYQDMQSKSVSALSDEGYTPSEIQSIKNTSYEDLMYARAQLPEDQLKDMGYSDNQISDLKQYDGSDLRQHPEIVALSASLSGSVYVLSYSTTKIKTRFHWEWSTYPAFFTKDIVACGWSGINPSGVYIAAQAIESETKCSVTYKSDTTTEYATVPVSIPNKLGKASATIALDPAHTGYPMSGDLDVAGTKLTSGSTLHSISFTYSYGHTTKQASPSVSIDCSGLHPTITFENYCNEMYSKNIIVSIGGDII